MTDIKKYVEGKSQEELLEIQRTSVVDGEIYKAVTFEIQRIQQDTNNIQIANLIGEIQKIKDIASENSDSSKRFATSSLAIAIVAIISSFIIGGVQIYLAKIGVGPILEEEYRTERRLYESCKEPGTWNMKDGGSASESTCKNTYLKFRERFGTYLKAESVLKNHQ